MDSGEREPVAHVKKKFPLNGHKLVQQMPLRRIRYFCPFTNGGVVPFLSADPGVSLAGIIHQCLFTRAYLSLALITLSWLIHDTTAVHEMLSIHALPLSPEGQALFASPFRIQVYPSMTVEVTCPPQAMIISRGGSATDVQVFCSDDVMCDVDQQETASVFVPDSKGYLNSDGQKIELRLPDRPLPQVIFNVLCRHTDTREPSSQATFHAREPSLILDLYAEVTKTHSVDLMANDSVYIKCHTASVSPVQQPRTDDTGDPRRRRTRSPKQITTPTVCAGTSSVCDDSLPIHAAYSRTEVIGYGLDSGVTIIFPEAPSCPTFSLACLRGEKAIETVVFETSSCSITVITDSLPLFGLYCLFASAVSFSPFS